MKSSRCGREIDLLSVGFFFFPCGIQNRIPSSQGACISPSSPGFHALNFGLFDLLQTVVFVVSIWLLISLGTV